MTQLSRTTPSPPQPAVAAVCAGSRCQWAADSATRPPTASSHARVGSEKNAHGGELCVQASDKAKEITATAVSLAAPLLWRGRRQPRLELAGLGLVVLGAAAVLWNLRHGLSAIARVHVWLSALAMIRDHPLLGVGPDNFLYYYVNPRAIDPHNAAASNCPALPRVLPAPHYLDLRDAWQEPCLSHPHNVVLDTWLSTGLLGLVALALVLVGFAMLARRNLRVCGAGWPRAVQVGCCAIVLATLVHGLVDNSIFVPDLAVAFWLALALTSVGSMQKAVGSSAA